MNENEKYKIIKKLIETDGNKNAAALKLNCTRRHINRMIRGYINHVKEILSFTKSESVNKFIDLLIGNKNYNI